MHSEFRLREADTIDDEPKCARCGAPTDCKIEVQYGDGASAWYCSDECCTAAEGE